MPPGQCARLQIERSWFEPSVVRDISDLKGARSRYSRSRYFRQFQHWSNGHRIN